MMPLHEWSVQPTRAVLLLLAAAVVQGVEQLVQNDVGKCRLNSRYGPSSFHLLLQLLRFLYATDLMSLSDSGFLSQAEAICVWLHLL
jgi:hypothetical protein